MTEKKKLKHELKFGVEVMRRASCIFEVILQERNQARAVVLLLKKKSTNWWELPGGEIEQGEEPNVRSTIEMREEAGIDLLSTEYIAANLINDPMGGYDNPLHLETNAHTNIVTMPFLVRRVSSTLPIVKFDPINPEHYDFRWLEFTGVYKEPRKNHVFFLEELGKQEIIVGIDEFDPKIISLQNKKSRKGFETIRLSEVSRNLLKRYEGYIMTTKTSPPGLEQV